MISPGISVQAAISRQREMIRVARSEFVTDIDTNFYDSGFATNASFDVSVRLVSGNEDLVGIVLAEAGEIDE